MSCIKGEIVKYEVRATLEVGLSQSLLVGTLFLFAKGIPELNPGTRAFIITTVKNPTMGNNIFV